MSLHLTSFAFIFTHCFLGKGCTLLSWYNFFFFTCIFLFTPLFSLQVTPEKVGVFKKAYAIVGGEVKGGYQCPHCSYSSPYKHVLRNHVNTHAGYKPYQCSYCPKKCLTKSNLALHVRQHTGERPFQCPHCPKKYSSKSHLKKHSLLHTGDMPYCCSYCSFASHYKHVLRDHMLSHAAEKF